MSQKRTAKIMTEKTIHAFEAGRRGKPDELDTNIANLISSHFLQINPFARFDIRVAGTYQNNKPLVRVSGELTETLLSQKLEDNITQIILDHYNNIHKTQLPNIQTEFHFKPQAAPLAENTCAGDSGYPLAVAYKTTPYHLPWERFLAVEIRNIIDTIYQNNGIVPEWLAQHCTIHSLKGLRADGKIGVEAVYDGAYVDCLRSITIAAEHDKTLPVEQLRTDLSKLITTYLHLLEDDYTVQFSQPHIHINTLGDWNEGGEWQGDEGSREAKPYRDGFGSYGCLEDSFSGEDPTKPTATGSFLARNIAVHIVTNNWADFAKVILTYTIGREDVHINITTQGTGKKSQQELELWAQQKFPLGIQGPIELFNLRNPKLYQTFAETSDFFHNPEYQWNKKIVE